MILFYPVSNMSPHLLIHNPNAYISSRHLLVLFFNDNITTQTTLSIMDFLPCNNIMNKFTKSELDDGCYKRRGGKTMMQKVRHNWFIYGYIIMLWLSSACCMCDHKYSCFCQIPPPSVFIWITVDYAYPCHLPFHLKQTLLKFLMK